MSPPMKLRELIRKVRAARTAADERSVIQKESAYIRSLFREENNIWRYRNVAKLLYMHILGYPAYFGQLECLKLIASSRFIDKRIGYLGCMLLLDERQDLHLLITNSLKNDLNSQKQFSMGLALCAFGVISSPEMIRSLAGEIEKLLKSSNVYIRKKATLCALRIIKKVPELTEMFIPATYSLLSEKNHGVLITGIILVTEMCEKSPDVFLHFKKYVPNLISVLKDLVMTRCAPEYSVCGISDPFLQVKILRLLRLLGKDDCDASEKMNDVLAQVATNIENTRNVGNAILYETVLTVMDIRSEKCLRTLGINTLGRFLLNADRNIRYVALNILLCCADGNNKDFQRICNIVVDCLKDVDVSIQAKAMELCFIFVNSKNIEYMTKELLIFLAKAEPELKSRCSFNLFIAAEKYAPSRRWLIDIMIEILTIVGNYAIDDLVGNLIQLISETSSLHTYTVQQLWKQLTSNVSTKQPLVQVACWCIGEFGDYLNFNESQDASPVNASPDEVIEMFEKIGTNIYNNLITKEYATTTLMKLSVRFPDSALRVKRSLDLFGTNVNVELQQRAIEFSSLFQKYNHLNPNLLAKMPAMENKSSNITGSLQNKETAVDESLEHDRKGENVNHKNIKDSNMLLDFLSDSSHETLETETPTKEKRPQDVNMLLDFLLDSHDSVKSEGFTRNDESQGGSSMLLDLLSSPSEITITTETATTDDKSLGANSNVLDLIKGLQHNSQIQKPICASAPNTSMDKCAMYGPSTKNSGLMKVYEKNGLKIIFEFNKLLSNSKMIIINLIATNNSSLPIYSFLFQAAVPKGFQLQLLPPSNTVLPANNLGHIRQTLKILNSTNGQLRMKLRISYVSNGNPVLEELELNDIPRAAYL